MKYKKMTYYSFENALYPGVLKKINNTVQAAKNIGIEAEHKFYDRTDKIESIKDFMADSSDLIFIRFSSFIYVFLLPFILYKRIKGVAVVVDVPTPRAAALLEMRGANAKHLWIKLLWNYIFCSWIFFPVSKIIQYSEESKFFSMGVRHKTMKMGNGILIDDSIKILPQKRKPSELKLIGVASLAFWHGYDRLIKAIDLFRVTYPGHVVSFKIVGDGSIKNDLECLVDKLNLHAEVVFTGALYGEDLESAYAGANVGVASLGLFRIGLDEASVLKSREYMAKGLCVLGAADDPDFDNESVYRYVVPNDESIEPIVDVLWKMINSELAPPEAVRRFAEKNLAYEGKLSAILDSL